ncbi:hypothetical protein [Streptomyces sp. NEAU-S7GS2]|uniref:hypothetical protein n=1 Tax=Streptomyces sp. NEAU-S7GS2 TaxID=2202000 RepID=UPI0013A53C3D|nr:hypothetical protein [Streptomyces sp. NEAU-S7GS2]
MAAAQIDAGGWVVPQSGVKWWTRDPPSAQPAAEVLADTQRHAVPGSLGMHRVSVKNQ